MARDARGRRIDKPFAPHQREQEANGRAPRGPNGKRLDKPFDPRRTRR